MPNVGKIERVSLSEVWQNEALDSLTLLSPLRSVQRAGPACSAADTSALMATPSVSLPWTTASCIRAIRASFARPGIELDSWASLG